MAILIRYVKYTFKIAPIPSEVAFEGYEKTLPLVPNLDIEPKYKTFLQLNPHLKKVSVIKGSFAVILILIYVICMEVFLLFKPGGTFDIIFMVIFVLFILMCLGLIISTFFSFNSYSTFKWESKKYYVKLKELVIKSNNYIDFLHNYKAQFGNELNKGTTTYDKLNQRIDKLFGTY
jgi:hypothetical protein